MCVCESTVPGTGTGINRGTGILLRIARRERRIIQRVPGIEAGKVVEVLLFHQLVHAATFARAQQE